MVGKLGCYKGISTQTAMCLLTEILDWRRFSSPRALMSYLGVVSSEHSSGEHRRQGSITKAGNARCRRVLIEASWHYRHKPCVGPVLKKRQQGQPAGVVVHAWKAQHRLHKKYWSIAYRKE